MNVMLSIPAILVYGSDGRTGNPLGYLSQSFSPMNDYFVTTDCTKAMVNSQLLTGALINPVSSF